MIIDKRCCQIINHYLQVVDYQTQEKESAKKSKSQKSKQTHKRSKMGLNLKKFKLKCQKLISSFLTIVVSIYSIVLFWFSCNSFNKIKIVFFIGKDVWFFVMFLIIVYCGIFHFIPIELLILLILHRNYEFIRNIFSFQMTGLVMTY